MTNVLRTSLVAIVAVLALGFFATTASAATIPGFYNAIFDGYTDVYGEPNERVDVTVRVEAESGEVVHAVSTDFIGDGVGQVCHDISNFEGAQDRDVDLRVNLPKTTGDYDLLVEVFTADTMQEANALRGSVACAGDVDTDAPFTDSVHVIPGGTSGSTGDDNLAAPSWFQTWLEGPFAEIIAALLGDEPQEANPKCTALQDKLIGTVDNTYNQANVRLQGFLLSEGYSIPALEQGAAFGYKGTQTNGALAQFKSANQCF